MQLYAVVFTPRAERQLDDLYTYISTNSSEAQADSYISRIVADCMLLQMFPERGTKRDYIRPNLRTKGYKRRVTIAFSVHVEAATVAIHGIFYGGQDYEQLLSEEDED